MRICVYGASSNRIEQKYIAETEEFGRILVRRGHSVVCGAGAQGLMGAVQRGAHEAGGEIVGIVPYFFKEVDGALFDACTELIFTENMRDRKKLMEDRSDAFVVTPGGIGTFDEFFEMLTLKQLDRHDKPIVVYNMFGYYDALEEMIAVSIQNRFVNASCKELYAVLNTADEVLRYLETYKPGVRGTRYYKSI